MIKYILLLMLFFSCQSNKDLTNYKAMLKDKSAIGLDVRSPQELLSNPAVGATHIPMTELEFKTSQLDKNKKILIFCESGGRASKAKRFLESKGFQVENIKDWRTWNKINQLK